MIVSLSDRAIDHPSRSSPHPEPAPSLPTHPVLGDFLALLSAVAYALYVILLKVRVKTEARISMTLFFGFVGAWNIILLWPLGFLLHFTGIETWELPHGRALWAGIAVNSAITFVRPTAAFMRLTLNGNDKRRYRTRSISKPCC